MKRQNTSRQRPFMLMIVAVSLSLIIVSQQNASSQKPGGLVLPYHGVTTDKTAAFEITNEDDNKLSVGGLVWRVSPIQMLRARRYSIALWAAILALIPLTSVCCIPGIPIGIWALIVLRNPDVRAAFES